MKTAILLVLTTITLQAQAQTNCYPQVVATPTGLVTIIVCPDAGVAR